jgi:hypothetical protein
LLAPLPAPEGYPHGAQLEANAEREKDAVPSKRDGRLGVSCHTGSTEDDADTQENAPHRAEGRISRMQIGQRRQIDLDWWCGDEHDLVHVAKHFGEASNEGRFCQRGVYGSIQTVAVDRDLGREAFDEPVSNLRGELVAELV